MLITVIAYETDKRNPDVSYYVLAFEGSEDQIRVQQRFKQGMQVGDVFVMSLERLGNSCEVVAHVENRCARG